MYMFRESNHDETGGIPIPVKPDASGAESGVYDVMFVDQSPEEISLSKILNGIEQQDGGLNPADIYFDTDEKLAGGFKEFQSKRLEVYRKFAEVFVFFKELSSKMPSKRSSEPILDESLVEMTKLVQNKEKERTQLINALLELQREGGRYRNLAEERYADFLKAVAELETEFGHFEKKVKDKEYIFTRVKKQYSKEYRELDEIVKKKKGKEAEIKGEEAWKKMAANIESVKGEINKELEMKKKEVDLFKRKLSLLKQTVRVLEIYQRLDEIKLKKLQEIA